MRALSAKRATSSRISSAVSARGIAKAPAKSMGMALGATTRELLAHGCLDEPVLQGGAAGEGEGRPEHAGGVVHGGGHGHSLLASARSGEVVGVAPSSTARRMEAGRKKARSTAAWARPGAS